MITKPLQKTYNLTLTDVCGHETLCTYASLEDIKNRIVESPIPLEALTNLGINLSVIKMLSWKKLEDNQITEFTIHFNIDDTILNTKRTIN